MTEGYITAASGRRKHLEMAVDFALSVRDFDPKRPIAVVVDPPRAEIVARHYPHVFDHVAVAPAEHRKGYAPKLWSGEATLCDRTLFVDADCLLLRSLDELWALLEPLDYSMMGELFPTTAKLHHNNIPLRVFGERFQLERYFLAFGAIFYFRKEAGREVLGECLDLLNGPLDDRRYHRWDTFYTPDEFAWGIVGAKRELGRFPPYPPFITWREAGEWRVGEAPRPIFHCTFWPGADILDWLMRDVRRRREEAGLRQGSEGYWRRKAWTKRIQDLFAGGRRARQAAEARKARGA